MEVFYQNGCDLWDPTSMNCRWNANAYCMAQGFAGGYGPLGFDRNMAELVCLLPGTGDYREFAFQKGAGACSSLSAINSVACQNYVRSQCLAGKYRSSIGVIGAHGGIPGIQPGVVATVCLKDSAGALEIPIDWPTWNAWAAVSLDASQPVDSNHPPACSTAALRGDRADLCQFTFQAVCAQWAAAHNYSAAAGLNAYMYSGGGADTFTCIPATLDANSVIPPGAYGNGWSGDSWIRPARIGSSFIMGGRAEYDVPTGRITYGDMIYNNTATTLIVTRIDVKRAIDAAVAIPSDELASGEFCFSKNQDSTWQHDNGDGEIACVGSDTADIPSLDFEGSSLPPNSRARYGFLLHPNEFLIFHATPNFNYHGLGTYGFAVLKISEYVKGGGILPIKRVRYPRVDTGYFVNKQSSPLIYAGCVGSCLADKIMGLGTGQSPDGSPTPWNTLFSVTPDTPLGLYQNTNWWYPVPAASNIRGISTYTMSGRYHVNPAAYACPRIVSPDSKQSSYGKCFGWLRGDPASSPPGFMSSKSYDQLYGLQGGSAFAAFNPDADNVALPANSLVGMDFVLSSGDSPGYENGAGNQPGSPCQSTPVPGSRTYCPNDPAWLDFTSYLWIDDL